MKNPVTNMTLPKVLHAGLFFISICFLSLNSNSQEASIEDNIWNPDAPSPDERDLRKNLEPEQDVIRDHVVLYDGSDNVAALEKKYYTSDDSSKLSLSYETSRKLYRPQEHIFMSAMYSYNFKSFWLDFSASSTQTQFDLVGENKSNTSVGNGARPDDLEYQIYSFHVGVTYRFKFITHFTNFGQVFETTSAYGSYNMATEKLSNVNHTIYQGLASSRDLTYKGPGMRAVYGIHYRSSSSIQYGLQLSYNLLWLSRDSQYANESDSSRQLTLFWPSLGVDCSYYF